MHLLLKHSSLHSKKGNFINQTQLAASGNQSVKNISPKLIQDKLVCVTKNKFMNVLCFRYLFALSIFALTYYCIYVGAMQLIYIRLDYTACFTSYLFRNFMRHLSDI